MPLKSGRLTHREKAWAGHMARTGDALYSAQKAGYPHPGPRATENKQSEALMNEVEAIRDKLRKEGAEIGVGVLIELASDKKQPPGVRRAAASDLVKYSGIAASDEKGSKELHEMTAEELTQHIARGMQRLAEAQRPQLELEAVDANVFE